jgi:signal transduction histidine kinase
MAYRKFRRFLGETNLERKCRWMMGSATLVLMTVSFLIYAGQTESLAYDQLAHTGRTLIPPILARAHIKTNPELRDGFDEFQRQSEGAWSERYKGYSYRVILLSSTSPARAPTADDVRMVKTFQEDASRSESSEFLREKSTYIFNGAIRASGSCVVCHRDTEKMLALSGDTPESRKILEELVNPQLQPGDLMGVISIELNTEMIESGLHQNRALLYTFAITTTLLILLGIYLIIRFVIVRPVKHLKSVSEAIANGQTTIRSEIHTGDEFEDLSVAFNRMLTNLIQVQQRNRTLIVDLDHRLDDLARKNFELFQSNKTKDDFLWTMSHELRTPLNHVIGFSETLLQADNLTERQHRYVGNIHNAGQALLAIINEVLELAKAESGQMRARPAMIDYVGLCEQVAALFRVQAEKKNIELSTDLPATRLLVRQDHGKLRQILSNLLSNAVKFTPEGGRVQLTARETPTHLVFEITDTGIGIAPEEQEFIFQKFRQSSDPLTREQSGTGLGLSIVRELARLLGGDVSVQSELGRGSTFVVRIARELPDDPRQVADATLRTL